MSEEIIEGFRLSPTQKRLWRQMDQHGASAFRSAVRILVRGKFDHALLQKAWQRLVDRHEVLRTTFSSAPGLDFPLQVIGSAEQATVQVREKGELQSEVEVVTSVMLADRRTMQNVVAELARCYEAACFNRELTDEPVQYVQFSEWQHEMLESEEAERARQLWPGNIARESGVLRLPHERDGLKSTNYAPQSVAVEVSQEVQEKLKQIGSIEEVFEAGWRVLLRRLSGEADVTVARLFDGRTYEELQEAFGLYGKYLPISTRLSGNLRFREVLERVHKSISEVSEWQEYLAADDLIEQSSTEKASLIGFDYESRKGPFQAAGIEFAITHVESFTECFKLRLSGFDINGSLDLRLHYDPDLYAVETATRLAGELAELFRSIAHEPKALISDLDILGTRERQRMLVEWNNTKFEFPQGECIHELFEAQVERAPHAIAVEHENAQLTFLQLNQRANQLAHHLRSLGVGPETRVGVLMSVRST